MGAAGELTCDSLAKGDFLETFEAPARDRRYDGLQWGRAIAALMVALVHASIYPFPSSGITHLLSRFAVTLFFVISGYLMVVTTGERAFDGVRFLKKRLLRVAPLYYVATLLAAVAVLIAPQGFKDTVFDVPHLVMSLLFLPMYEPGHSGAIDPFLRLGWTLNYEMYFYVIFALLCRFGQMNRAILMTALFCATTLLGQMFKFENAMLQFYTRVDPLAFMGGVWLAVLCKRFKGRLAATPSLLLLVVAMLALAGIHQVYGGVRDIVWTQIAIDAICTLVIAVLALTAALPGGVLHRGFMAAGDASYSMYLFHMFAVGAAHLAFSRLLPHLDRSIAVVLTCAAAVAAGLAAYWLIERPLQALVRPLGDQRNKTQPQTA